MTMQEKEFLLKGDAATAINLSSTSGREIRLKVEEILDGRVDALEKMMETESYKSNKEYASARNIVGFNKFCFDLFWGWFGRCDYALFRQVYFKYYFEP